MFGAAITLVTLGGIIGPASGPVHYRIEIKSTQVADLTAVNGQTQTQIADVTGFVTLVESDSAGAHWAVFKIDSVKVAPGDNVPPNLQGDPSEAKGVTYRAQIVNGKSLNGFKTLQTQPHANLFSGAYEAIFPGFRAGAKSGEQWTDTTKLSDTFPTVRESSTVTIWTVSAAAPDQVTISGTSTGSTSSTQAGPSGLPVLISGTSTGTRAMTGFAGAGAIRGTVSAKQALTYTSGSINFPIKVEVQATIERLP